MLRYLVASVFLFLSMMGSAYALTKVGVYGDGMQFYITKFDRETEGTVHTVSVKGILINKFDQTANYELNLICNKTGTIYVSALGKKWEMRTNQEVRWVSESSSMKGYFAVYNRLCTDKYKKSPMSNRDRKNFEMYD